MQISVQVLTKNTASFLGETLAALRFFPEVVVYDTGSTDQTLEVAREFPNVVIHQGTLNGFGPTHNTAASLASNDWILSVDSDEVLSEALVQELLQLKLDPSCVYAIRRDNYLDGKVVRCCAGWHPDWVVRLYNRKTTSFTDDVVHEKVKTEGLKVVKLTQTIKHVPYRTREDFLKKMETYSTFFALQHKGKKHSSMLIALLRSGAAFCKNYFLKWGFLGGTRGIVISLHNTKTTFYKYLKLAELNKKL